MSESDSEPALPTDSFGSAQLLAEERATQLEEHVAALTKENARLRAQFEEIGRLSSRLEEVHAKNRQLSSAIRDMKAESDSLQQRLDISLRANGELSQKLEDEKQRSFAQRSKDQATFQQELQRVKAQSKTQTDEIYRQLDSAQEANHQLQIADKLSTAKLSKILHNAKLFFGTEFPDVDELITFLGKPIVTTQVTQQPPPPSMAPKVERKLRSIAARLKDANAARDDLGAQLLHLQREKADGEARFRQQIADIDARNRTEAVDREAAEASQAHAIQTLEAKVESLKAELASRRRVEATPVAVHPPPPPPALPAKPKPKDSDSRVDEVFRRNGELSNQLQAAVSRRDACLERLREVEQRNTELEMITKKAEMERDAVGLVHKETVSELETVRTALRAKESQKDTAGKSRLKRSILSQRAENATLQNTIETQEREIHDLRIAKMDAERKIEQQNAKIVELKRSIAEDAKAVDRLQADLCVAECQAKPPATLDDLLPQPTWLSSAFEPELNAAIARIVENPAFQPASRLQNIYLAIRNHFLKALHAREHQLDRAYEENQAIRAVVHEFLVAVSLAISVSPVTFSDFFSQKGDESLLNSIVRLKADCEELKRGNDQLRGVLTHFHEQLDLKENGDVSTVIQHISALRDRLEKQYQKIKRAKEKYRDSDQRLKELSKQAEIEAGQMQSQIVQLTEKVSSLSDDNRDLLDQNGKLKRAIQTLRQEYRDLQQATADGQEEIAEKHETEIRASQQARDSLEAQLRADVQSVSQRLEETSESLANATETIKILKDTIATQERTIAEQDVELSTAKAESKDNREETRAKHAQEVKLLTDKYERALSDLREQGDRYRSDLGKLTADLSQAEKRNKDARTAILDLRREAMRHEKELRGQKEQMERDRKLNDAATKSAVLQNESQCVARLNQQKGEWVSEKTRLIGYVAEAFKQFFNPQDGMDERAFRRVVSRVRQELTTLSEANAVIRRIVGAAANQRTDDAVAQAFLAQE